MTTRKRSRTPSDDAVEGFVQNLGENSRVENRRILILLGDPFRGRRMRVWGISTRGISPRYEPVASIL